MKKYLIIFNKSGFPICDDVSSKKVYEYLKSFKDWAKFSESTYIIQTNLKMSEIRDHILDITDHHGDIYVLGLNGKYAIFGPEYVQSILYDINNCVKEIPIEYFK